MTLLQFNRWYRRRRRSNSAQIYDAAPYTTEVIEFEHDMEEAERQLKIANEQIEMQSKYPGRKQR
jgi:hypothetical protein